MIWLYLAYVLALAVSDWASCWSCALSIIVVVFTAVLAYHFGYASGRKRLLDS